MNASRKVLGHDALPILLGVLRTTRSMDVKADAIQEIEALDPNLLYYLVPDLRKVFAASSPTAVLYGVGTFAMYRLARVRDVDSAPLFRRFATGQNPAHFTYRMPLVLADYIDDPPSLPRRIEGHDHEWMFWLADAAVALRLQEAIGPLRRIALTGPDEACRETCREALEALERPEPEWDFESE